MGHDFLYIIVIWIIYISPIFVETVVISLINSFYFLLVLPLLDLITLITYIYFHFFDWGGILLQTSRSTSWDCRGRYLYISLWQIRLEYWWLLFASTVDEICRRPIFHLNLLMIKYLSLLNRATTYWWCHLRSSQFIVWLTRYWWLIIIDDWEFHILNRPWRLDLFLLFYIWLLWNNSPMR